MMSEPATQSQIMTEADWNALGERLFGADLSTTAEAS